MVLRYKTCLLLINIKKKRKLFTVCTEQVRSPYTVHVASGLPNPTYWEGEGGGTIYPGSTPSVTTLSPRMITECLLTRPMLIKIYIPVHGMCMYNYIVFIQSVSLFHADVYLVF